MVQIDEDKPWEIFDRLQESREFCNNCLRLNQEQLKPIPYTEIEAGVKEPRDPDFETSEISFAKGNRKERTRDGTARGACECGVYSPYDTVRPMNKYVAMRRADKLCETLEEIGVRFDRDVLLNVVYRRLTQPETAGRYEDSFELAVKHSVLRNDDE